MIFINSKSTDPAFNLALEEYVFEVMPKDKEYFMLWQNANTIVVGKHQNTAGEINAAYVKEHGIKVVRRLSGGGAVYHDMGNVNFTFVADAGNIEKLNFNTFCIPVVSVLERLGIQAEISGRNDITINGQKFSGNSQYIKGGRIMHHGTLMFDSDLSVVADALKVSNDKIESKGIKSVRSRITNIRPHLKEDVDIEYFKKTLTQNMTQGKEIEQYYLTTDDIQAIEEIKKKRYDTWEWNYGKSPKFNIQKIRRIEGCGKLEVLLKIENGIITDYESYGDYFGNGATKELKERIIGCQYNKEALQQRLEDFDLDNCYSRLDLNDFLNILLL